MSSELVGVAWDHPRAVLPLAAGSHEWMSGVDTTVRWDARPLKDFEDQSLADLAARYDLVLIDYPFVGTAATDALLVPVEEWADAAYLAEQQSGSVGPSFESYRWGERHWALPIDAACQVAALRPELMRAAGADTPRTWSEVLLLASRLGPDGPRMAIPLMANHAYCAFVSLGRAFGGADFWRWPEPWNDAPARHALATLRDLAALLHPMSRNADPIDVSEAMVSTDDIAYVPLMFGYSSYARAENGVHAIEFTDAPRGTTGLRGSVLGGVGIGVSASSAHRDDAASLARFLCSPGFQAGGYVAAGGQPAHASGWESSEANAMTDGLFRATRATMDDAFIRPRIAGHRAFQPAAGAVVADAIWSDTDLDAVCTALADLAAEHLVADGDVVEVAVDGSAR